MPTSGWKGVAGVGRLERLLWYLAVLSSFFGTALLAWDIGPLTLFPYRVFMISLWVVFAFRMVLSGEVRIPRTKVRAELGLFAVWLVYAVLSFAWAASKTDVLRHVVFLFVGVSLIFFATYYSREQADLYRLLFIWLFALGALIGIGFWEYFTGQHLPQSKFFGTIRTDFMFSPTGVWVNPNDYATFLSISFPFALSVARYAKNGLAKVGGALLALAAVYLIVASHSRANMIAILLQLGFLVVFLTSVPQKVKLGVMTATVIVFLVVLTPGPLLDFVNTITSQVASVVAGSEGGDRSISTRTNLIRNSLSFVHSTGGLGVGAGNAEYWMEQRSVHDTGMIRNVHNWWFEILTNYGMVIFTGYLIVYFRVMGRLWLCWRRATYRHIRMFAEPLLLALIGFSIAAASSSSIAAFNPNWMLFAFALAFLKLHGKQRASRV